MYLRFYDIDQIPQPNLNTLQTQLHFARERKFKTFSVLLSNLF